MSGLAGREEQCGGRQARLSGSWRLFLNLNSSRGTKSVLIFSKLVLARSMSGIVFASKLPVAATAITLNLSLPFHKTRLTFPFTRQD